LNEPIAGATVTVLKNGMQPITVQTGGDGKFSFRELKAGNYDLRVEAGGYQSIEFPIVMAKPDAKCNRSLEIRLYLGYPDSCPDAHIVKR
jgi:hypothetical protein